MTVIDFAKIDASRRYKLVVSSLVPRPIAWVTTNNSNGSVNAAPFSFFGGVCDDPIALAVGVNSLDDEQKDTSLNIRRTGEFVVNMVDELSLKLMNETSVRHPNGVSELEMLNIPSEPGLLIDTPRIAAAPVAFECRRLVGIELAVGKNVVIGQVVAMYVKDDIYDGDRMHVDAKSARMVGRMHGEGWYSRTQDLIHIARPRAREII